MRLKIFERDNFTCKLCGDKESTLNVHHKNYYFNKDPWDCGENNLVTLCNDCHSNEHHFKEQLSNTIHDLLLMGESYFSIWSRLRIEYNLGPFKDE